MLHQKNFSLQLQVIEQDNKQRKVKYNNYLPGTDESIAASEVQLHEKRTRFSLSHDQDSIGTRHALIETEKTSVVCG